jgi:hypothetical protein
MYRKYPFIIIGLKKYLSRNTIPLNHWTHCLTVFSSCSDVHCLRHLMNNISINQANQFKFFWHKAKNNECCFRYNRCGVYIFT